MKIFLFVKLIILTFQFPLIAQPEIANNTIDTLLKGSYLGQNLPSKTAELFAPGIISTGDKEALYGVFNNGSCIIFDRTTSDFSDPENYPIYICQEIDGKWTQPELTEHLGKPWYFNHPNPVHNEELFYAWWLPLDSNGRITNINIWKVKYINDGWGEPEMLPYPVNTESFEAFPSITNEGVIYFHSTRQDGQGRADIYRSVPENGKYTTVENLGPIINSSGKDHDPCISADGSFLIFSSERAGSLGRDDLYVSFQQEDGKWSDPENLGEQVNSAASDNRPYLTPDEKYLFFTSTRNGNLDIFWINAEIIQDLVPITIK